MGSPSALTMRPSQVGDAVMALAASEVERVDACGTPVLVPPDSAQAEVAGEAGIVVDPEDADSVADGLTRAIETREELRYVLPERAREFTWERTARGVAEVWRGLA